jgi:hypothetical protein
VGKEFVIAFLSHLAQLLNGIAWLNTVNLLPAPNTFAHAISALQSVGKPVALVALSSASPLQPS